MSPAGERKSRGGGVALTRECKRLKDVNEALVCSALEAQARADQLDRALDALAQAAQLDPLTRLPNRVHLLDRLEHAMAQARRSEARVALLFVDLDGFKQINDRLGHAMGDRVLQWAARAITGAVREVDTVSRHGGDEFVIVLDAGSDAAVAAKVAHKIIAALSRTCRVGNHRARLSASIGISLFPDHGEQAAMLIDHADAAMYDAKQGGSGVVCVYGDAPAARQADALAPPPMFVDDADADPDRTQMQMREANSELVMAALDAQQLLSACEKAQQRQTEFMGVLAHELRSPLTPIRIAAGMLGRAGDDDALQDQLKSIIDGQITRMAELVGDLLDVSRVRTGKLHMSWQRMDLLGIVEDVVASARLSTDAREQHLSLAIPDQPLTIRGDPARLAQVFSNLVDNAMRYTPQGGRITVEVMPGEGQVQVAIEDSGIGIDADTLPHIFEPFVQDTHAVGFSNAGLGIGLTVVQALVQAHGGDIAASSAGVGGGSRFTVTLPLLDKAVDVPPGP